MPKKGKGDKVVKVKAHKVKAHTRVLKAKKIAKPAQKKKSTTRSKTAVVNVKVVLQK